MGMDASHRRSQPVILTVISTLARLGLAAVGLASGWLKFSAPLDTMNAFYAYELFPEAIVPAMATVVPIVELILGVLLLLGIAVRLSAGISALMFMAFIALIISAWARGLTIDCGCFGGGGYDPESGPRQYLEEILRDIGFTSMALWLVVFVRTPWALLRSERS